MRHERIVFIAYHPIGSRQQQFVQSWSSGDLPFCFLARDKAETDPDRGECQCPGRAPLTAVTAMRRQPVSGTLHTNQSRRLPMHTHPIPRPLHKKVPTEYLAVCVDNFICEHVRWPQWLRPD